MWLGGFCAAVDDTVSAGKAGKAGKPGKAGKAGKFPEACFYAQAWCLSIMDPPGIGHGIKKLCAGAVVCEGHGAPVQAPARPAQLSLVKHICSGSLFLQDWLRALQLMRWHGCSCTMGHAQKCCFGGQCVFHHWVLEKRSRRTTTAVLLVFAVRVFFALVKNVKFNENQLI